jgi:hypothetical protein
MIMASVAVPRSEFHVPGSCSVFVCTVRGSWFVVFEPRVTLPGTSNGEPRTLHHEPEPRTRTWNAELGTGNYDGR